MYILVEVKIMMLRIRSLGEKDLTAEIVPPLDLDNAAEDGGAI